MKNFFSIEPLLSKVAGLGVKGLYSGISRDLYAIFHDLSINYDFGNEQKQSPGGVP